MMNQFRPGRFQVLPNIVKNLIIINVIMVFLQYVVARTFHINLQDYLALHYWRSPQFRPWQLITHIFMHGSPLDIQATALHLISNMFALWMFGSILEGMWGPKRFLLFYILCGIGASLCYMGVLAVQYEPMLKLVHAFQASPTFSHYMDTVTGLDLKNNATYPSFKQLWSVWENDPANPSYSTTAVRFFKQYTDLKINEGMVGASGAVFGVLFAFGYLFPNTELMLLFPPMPVKAKWVVTFYGLFELYAAFQNSQDDNVAHVAHLGGMLIAFILLKFWFQRERRQFY